MMVTLDKGKTRERLIHARDVIELVLEVILEMCIHVSENTQFQFQLTISINNFN